MDAYGCDGCGKLIRGRGTVVEVCPNCKQLLNARGKVRVVVGGGEIEGEFRDGRVYLPDGWVNQNIRGRRY